MISTRDLSSLPDAGSLRRLMQSLAMLDAILMPEWQYRYFSFKNRWASVEQMGSMRNGEGDHYFALFNSSGCWLKGFNHVAPMSPFATNPPQITAGMYDRVPPEFQACLKEPAFVTDEATFCIWRRYHDVEWQKGLLQFLDGHDDPDGSASLLQYLDSRPETYRDWATDYYERDISLAGVQSIYAHKPLNSEILTALNADGLLPNLANDLYEIGYPSR